MKFIFKSILTVVAAVVLLLSFLYFYTGGMTRVADDFFAEESTDQANSFLSSYTVGYSAEIHSYLNNHDMNNIQSTSWHARNFVNNKGSIAGDVSNAQGDSIPTRVDFVKQDGDWKIYAIAVQTPKATLKPNEPDLRQQENLISQSMSRFMQAAQQKSMTTFHQYLSQFWQSQISVAELDKAFASIFKFKGDHNFLDNIKPTLNSAMIDENNLLVINGFFPLNNARIMITQKYIYEATEWRLMSFSYSNEKS